ncbi:MAG: hypothetical protein ABIJ74_02755 [archaeon]
MVCGKAQASVELLVILAVSMVAIGLILVTSNNEITGINSAKANSDAQNTVNKIARTAEEVFVSGPGTTKQIFVVIPSGVDETKTSVSDKTVRINVNGTDLIAESKTELSGSIPTEPGGHWVWITAFEGYVVIGDIKIESNKGSIYSAIAQDSNSTESISLKNNTSADANVTISFTWNSVEVSMNLSSNFFVVASGSSYSIDINFSSSQTAAGNYSGEIIFDATTTDGAKRIVVPVTVEVITGSAEKPLRVFPNYWNTTIIEGNSDSTSFQLCNTTDSTITGIDFIFSGTIALWIQPIPSVGLLTGNTCNEFTAIIDVPIGAGSSAGTITASDGINSDYISVTVSVPFNDTLAPTISLVSPSNGFVSGNFSVQFDYSVNDIDSGIAFCELIINGAVDQTDNSVSEGITQSFTKTFSVNGNYFWDINCVDDSANSNEGSSNENRVIQINVIQYPVVIAFDNFPDTSWNSGTGWTAGWIHSGDSSLVTSGGTYTPPRHLRLRLATGYATRAVDLSSYSKPRLEFWAKVNSFEGSDYQNVLVSSDGITWSVIKTFTSADSDNVYHFYAFDLNAYTLSGNFWVGFDAWMSGSGDYFYVDDISIVQRTP